jgi:hypothetical protein
MFRKLMSSCTKFTVYVSVIRLTSKNALYKNRICWRTLLFASTFQLWRFICTWSVITTFSRIHFSIMFPWIWPNDRNMHKTSLYTKMYSLLMLALRRNKLIQSSYIKSDPVPYVMINILKVFISICIKMNVQFDWLHVLRLNKLKLSALSRVLGSTIMKLNTIIKLKTS